MARGQPISIRLDDDVERLVEDERRRTGRSRSAVVEELAGEAAKTRLFPGIAFRGPQPRRPWLLGTGLDVWELVELSRAYGDDVRLLADFPHITPQALRLAFAYSERFPDEVESAIAENARTPEELAELYPFVELPERR